MHPSVRVQREPSHERAAATWVGVEAVVGTSRELRLDRGRLSQGERIATNIVGLVRVPGHELLDALLDLQCDLQDIVVRRCRKRMVRRTVVADREDTVGQDAVEVEVERRGA
jgi:hypothetical protein